MAAIPEDIKPDDLNWRQESPTDPTERLIYQKSEPTSIIRNDDGVVRRDTLPAQIPLFDYPWALGRVRDLDAQGLIPRIGGYRVTFEEDDEEIAEGEPSWHDKPFNAAFEPETYERPSRFGVPSGDETLDHRPTMTAEEAESLPTVSKWAVPDGAEAPQPIKRQKPAKQRKDRMPNRQRRRIAMLSIGAVVLAGAVTGGVVYGQTIFGGPSIDSSEAKESDNVVKGTRVSEVGEIVDGAAIEIAPVGWTAENPEWTFQFEGSTIAANAFNNGVFVSNAKSVTILDSITGETKVSLDIKGVPKFVSDATFGADDRGLVWRTGNMLYLWSSESNKVVYYILTDSVTVNTTGSGALVKAESKSHVATMEGLHPIEETDGTEIAVDKDTVIASGWSGPIELKNIETGETTSSLIQPPSPGMVVNLWHGAGYGKVYLSWRDPGQVNDSEAEVIVASHDASTGEVIAQTTAISGRVSKTEKVAALFGQGGELTSIGPILFDTQTGELVTNAQDVVRDFRVVLGQYAYGDNLGESGVTTYVGAEKQPKITGTMPIAVLEDGSAIVRTSDNTISRLLPE